MGSRGSKPAEPAPTNNKSTNNAQVPKNPAVEKPPTTTSGPIVEQPETQSKPKPQVTGEKLLKLVLVGDTSVGKSCLITNYLKNSFSEDYEPTVLDVYRGIKNVSKKQVTVELHDTSGDEHLGVNRKVQYAGADCFMICVAANS